MGLLEVKLVRSVIGASKRQKLTVRALGLRKIGQKVVHRDSPQIKGMIRKVAHLVEVREVG
ncbi:MAG: 50S ribosomal protein L30 [Candidatus Latescibacterota bacterium]|nr:MAG: 50S ribosomal protein L30 [Candidatus Latescibacterota bacterium]RKY71008.1 MAG: 50S ribosomal protein L30 [Candidatus Latescibacterota bacterium]HDI00011.1 50S ribosomal protein L30 [Bacillota bacterium]